MQLFSQKESFLLNSLPVFQHGIAATEPDIFGGQVVQTFMVSPCVAVDDELPDPFDEVFGEIVILEQNGVFHRPVPPFDHALGHRVIKSPAAIALVNEEKIFSLYSDNPILLLKNGLSVSAVIKRGSIRAVTGNMSLINS